MLDAEFDADVSHHLLGEIKRGTRLIEYYWLDRWYNVFRFLSDNGSTRLYYCNVNRLPSFDGHVLTYVDLDIDVIVQPDFSYDVLDIAEFEANSEALHDSGPFHVKAARGFAARSGRRESSIRVRPRNFPQWPRPCRG